MHVYAVMWFPVCVWVYACTCTCKCRLTPPSTLKPWVQGYFKCYWIVLCYSGCLISYRVLVVAVGHFQPLAAWRLITLLKLVNLFHWLVIVQYTSTCTHSFSNPFLLYICSRSSSLLIVPAILITMAVLGKITCTIYIIVKLL